MLVLVLEASTSSAKGMLYSTDEGVLSTVTQPYGPGIFDGATHDADGVFDQVMALGRTMAEDTRVDAVVLSGTWHSVLLCDHAFSPVSRSYSWSDCSAKDTAKRIRSSGELSALLYAHTGCMPNTTYPSMKLLSLLEGGTSLKDKYIFGQGSYHFFRLTGKRMVTDCMASGSGLLNVHTKRYDDQVLGMLGLEEGQLGEVVPYSYSAPLSKEGARYLGLPEGTPVMGALPDGALNQVGAGALQEGIMTFSVGTSAALRLSTHAPILPSNPSVWCYLAPTTWLSGAATAGACNCIDWFRRSVFGEGTPYREMEGDGQFREDHPIFLPFLFGERCPGWQDTRKGGFFDVLPKHSKYDLYHSVMEGILLNLYQCYQILCDLNGTPRTVKLSGGILDSKLWTRMCCDVFGIPMEVSPVRQDSLVGAAMVAHSILDPSRDIRSLGLQPGRIITPDMELHERYLKRYERYLYWYGQT